MSVDIKHKLWVEKYRPSTIEDFIGEESIIERFVKDISENTLQNYLFYGPPGTGKTTLAKLYCNSLECDYIYINASDERGIDTIREHVGRFARIGTFKSVKIVVLDESDYLTPQAQATLRNMIEEFSGKTRFIMTCNHINKVIDALKSRCVPVKITPPDRIQIGIHLGNILDREEVEWDVKDVMEIVNRYYPDQRLMLNTLQSLIQANKENKLIVTELVSDQTVDLIQLFNGEKNTMQFSLKLRDYVKKEKNINFDAIFRELVDRVDDIKGIQYPVMISMVNDAMYKSSFKVDPEINFVNFMIELKKQAYE